MKSSMPNLRATPLPAGCSSFKLRQLSRRVSQQYDAVLAAAGLKTSQYSLLSKIVRLGPVRPGELAAEMEMDASTLTRNLQPLVSQGWVKIGPGEDKRSRLVRVTAAGAESVSRRSGRGNGPSWHSMRASAIRWSIGCIRRSMNVWR